MTNTRQCTTCKQILPITDFHIKDSKTGRRMSVCKPCRKEKSAKRYIENKDAILAHQKSIRIADPVGYAEKQKRSAKKHPETRKKISKRYRERHPDKVLASNRKWAKENPEKKKQADKNFSLKNPTKVAEKHARRKSLSLQNKTFFISKKEWAKYYTQPCFACGKFEIGQMTVEHLIPKKRKGDHGIGNLTTLCKSCNSSKQDKTWMEWQVWKSRKEESPQSPTHD